MPLKVYAIVEDREEDRTTTCVIVRIRDEHEEGENVIPLIDIYSEVYKDGNFLGSTTSSYFQSLPEAYREQIKAVVNKVVKALLSPDSFIRYDRVEFTFKD